MFAQAEVQWYHWVGFVGLVLIFLAADLGVFHKHARSVSVKESLLWTSFFVFCALGFAGFLAQQRGRQEALEFLTGYLVELSLSMDNVFVIATIFRYFMIPNQLQHRVLFWGILGAILMRGIMIWTGSRLVARYDWIFYLFGIFLVVTGLRMLYEKEEEERDLSEHPVIRYLRRHFPVTHCFYGQSFIAKEAGRKVLTPLALALVMVETSDLLFALDSIPAIFAVTTKDYIVFTSNVFAILGLRSMYFLLANAVSYFAYLKYGLSVILIYVGIKMLIQHYLHIPTLISLTVVVLVIGGSIVLSIVKGECNRFNS